MIINIELEKGDDKVFMTGLNGMVARLITEFKPQDVYAFRINKWFDHEWLRYSGYGVVAYPERGAGPMPPGVPKYSPVAAKEEQYQDHLTFPPFNPKQKGLMHYWSRYENGNYGGIDKPRWPPRAFKKPSNRNMQNRVASFTDSGLFVWFTSNTETNQKGSIMVYRVEDGRTEAWYASLSNNVGWKVDKVKGISKESVEDWFYSPAP